MRKFTIYVKAGTGASASSPDFKLYLDGKLQLQKSYSDVSGGATYTVISYRDGHYFSFPACTHGVTDCFTADAPKYGALALYPTRKWLSYVPRWDSAHYNVEVLDNELI